MAKFLSNIANSRKVKILERQWLKNDERVIKSKKGLAYAPDSEPTRDEILLAKINEISKRLNLDVALNIQYVCATKRQNNKSNYQIIVPNIDAIANFANYNELVHTPVRTIMRLLADSDRTGICETCI